METILSLIIRYHSYQNTILLNGLVQFEYRVYIGVWYIIAKLRSSEFSWGVWNCDMLYIYIDQLWPCLTMLHVHPLILLTICDQARPDTTRCDQGWLCMHGRCICVWFAGMSVKNNQNPCFFIKSFLKGMYHVTITCRHYLWLYGKHHRHRLAAVDDLGGY